jgi:hypothetical protein
VIVVALAGGLLGTLVNRAADVPFQINRRPMPSGAVVDTLLPPDDGSFHRIDVREEPSGSATASYQDGNSTVTVIMTLFTSVEGARQAVAQVRSQTENTSGKRSYAIGPDPSYAYVPGLGRMAWSRGPYFYDVRASNQNDLDRFMEKFPY